jgi:hypothetical protein
VHQKAEDTVEQWGNWGEGALSAFPFFISTSFTFSLNRTRRENRRGIHDVVLKEEETEVVEWRERESARERKRRVKH